MIDNVNNNFCNDPNSLRSRRNTKCKSRGIVQSPSVRVVDPTSTDHTQERIANEEDMKPQPDLGPSPLESINNQMDTSSWESVVHTTLLSSIVLNGAITVKEHESNKTISN